MTRAEYLEYVQECCGFPLVPGTGDSDVNPLMQLRDTPEACEALRKAHSDYCVAVERVLFPDRFEQVPGQDVEVMVTR